MCVNASPARCFQSAAQSEWQVNRSTWSFPSATIEQQFLGCATPLAHNCVSHSMLIGRSHRSRIDGIRPNSYSNNNADATFRRRIAPL